MDLKDQSLLYRQPHLYELLYPVPDKETYVAPSICNSIFDKFLAEPPRSVLDVGCGTGRQVHFLSETCPDCVGIDYLPEMVAFAKSQYPHIEFIQGDMRGFRVNRTFDALICMGSTFMHALTNSDIRQTLDTFAAHSHDGSLLILDIKNSISFVTKEAPGTVEKEIETEAFTARYVMNRSFDLEKQLWIWKRTWMLPDQDPVEDLLEFRMLFPRELASYLAGAGYEILGMFDNPDLVKSDLTGNRLYVVAMYKDR
ncbi:MAG: class I SAM-dependent methyltransferase [Desulfobacter sp.]